MNVRLFFLALGLTTFTLAKSQLSNAVYDGAAKLLDVKQAKQLYSARSKFNNGFYKPAIITIDSIEKKDLKSLSFIKGVFYAYEESRKNKSLAMFEEAQSESNNLEGFYYHKAFALLRVDSFASAIECYKKALDEEVLRKNKNKKIVDDINLHIQQCKNILALKNQKNQADIKNIGHPVNSDFAEYCPIITSNESMIVFTYRGPRSTGGKQLVKGGLFNSKKLEMYFEDIYFSQKINDTAWTEPMSIPNLDTPEHDAAVCINSDGTEMFVYKNTGVGGGDLYLTKLKGTTWSAPIAQTGLNSNEWDGSACFINNQNRIIISSERKGGYGGKDLYYIDRIGENAWGNVTNMGPIINSKYDEDAPFVTTDGNILFFSTNNETSIGGYDIERSDLVNGFWTEPYNLGPPINTPNDDEYFTVRADGKVAYYSSSQKNGKGGQDIYMVKPGIPGKPVAMLQVEGVVTVDGKPRGGEVELRSIDKNPTLDYTVQANEVTGKFLCNLPINDEYELTIRTPNFLPQIVILNTSNIDSFVVLNLYTEFFSPEHGEVEHIQHAKEYAMLHIDEIEREMLHRFGDLKKEDVLYKVQIGAYKFPENFNYNNFIGLPKINKQQDSLGVSHFTCGEFHTYVEAHSLLRKVRMSIPDAFVVVYDKGRRVLLRDHLKEIKKQ